MRFVHSQVSCIMGWGGSVWATAARKQRAAEQGLVPATLLNPMLHDRRSQYGLSLIKGTTSSIVAGCYTFASILLDQSKWGPQMILVYSRISLTKDLYNSKFTNALLIHASTQYTVNCFHVLMKFQSSIKSNSQVRSLSQSTEVNRTPFKQYLPKL